MLLLLVLQLLLLSMLLVLLWLMIEHHVVLCRGGRSSFQRCPDGFDKFGLVLLLRIQVLLLLLHGISSLWLLVLLLLI